MKNVLVVVDYQNDFVTGALGFEDAVKLEKSIEERVQTALSNGDFVVFTKDTHSEEYLNTREGVNIPVPHCIKNTDGHALFGSLAKYESEYNKNILVVEKPTFGSMALPSEIRGFINGEPDSIEICGVVTNICVISNAVILHSSFLNAEISINSNLCAAVGNAHQNALDVMAGLSMKII